MYWLVHEVLSAGPAPCIPLLFIRLSLLLAVCLPVWLIGFMTCQLLGAQYLWALENLKLSK